jgi:hypothetical protein
LVVQKGQVFLPFFACAACHNPFAAAPMTAWR